MIPCPTCGGAESGHRPGCENPLPLMPGETKWPDEVEMVIDVCDDPPRPFLARELDRDGDKGYDWRENGEYLTQVYVPVSSPRCLSVEEAKAMGELVAGTPSSEEEQLALAVLRRLSSWAEGEANR